MKKLFLAVTFLITALNYGQCLSDGKYFAKLMDPQSEDEKVSTFYFTVSNGYVSQNDINPDKKSTIHNGPTTTMTWLNKSEVWSENQTFIFSKDLDNDVIYLNWFRVVQNKGSEPWNVSMVGIVKKY